jgi:cytochrome c556
MANAKASFQAFQKQYVKMSKMVPEWASRFPQAPVTALGKAVDGGNPAKIGPAMGGVGQVCASCHLLYQVKAQQKYHWRNFDDIKVTDPVSGQPLPLPDFMRAMSSGWEGALVDLQQGQADRSQKNWQNFRSQFSAMAAEACRQCHVDRAGNEIPRRYYVDADSTAMLDQMGNALSASQPDPAAIGELAGAIGNGICMNCHLVHFPAQNAKDMWETYAKVLKYAEGTPSAS